MILNRLCSRFVAGTDLKYSVFGLVIRVLKNRPLTISSPMFEQTLFKRTH